MKAMNWFFLSLMFFSANAFSAQCASDGVKSEFLSYEMKNSEPKYNEKLYDRYAESVLPEFIKFNENSFQNAASRTAAFRCLVGLEAAAQKWDAEGDGITLLAKTLKNNSALQKIFEAELQQFPDRCRAGLLDASVKARMCHDKFGDRETPAQSATCEEKFNTNNFKECQNFSSAEKKSPNKVAASEPCPSATPRQATGVTSGIFSSIKKALTDATTQSAAVSGASGVAQSASPSSRAPASSSLSEPSGNSRSRGPASVSPVYYPPEESSVSQ